MAVFGRDQWKELFLGLYNRVDSTDVFNRAAAVAFYFSFSLFPLLFFLITLAGLVLDSTDSLRHDLYRYLFQIMPVSAYTLVTTTLDEIIENSSGGKLTIGIFVTLWSASAGVDALRNSLNAIYELKESRSWWNTKFQSLVLTFLFILLLTVAIIAVSTGWEMFEHLLDMIGLSIDSPVLLAGVQWLLILLMLLFSTEVIYNWLPAHRKFRWYWITPGSLVAILLWVLFSGGFRIYLRYFNSYNRAYGSLGAVIILMLWMFLTATAILIGGAINSVLTELFPDEPEPNDDKPASKDDNAGVGK
ncbi:MAG: YihY/virulence factor BrkB family protein [Pyrinomonadaceae bacterium]